MHEEKKIVKQTNKLANKSKTLLEYKAEKAVRLLKEQISDIPDVQSWAKEAKVSRRWLCKSMKMVYGKPPKIIIREIKYEKVVWLIREDGIDANCYSVAVDAGFDNAKNVSRFLSSFYNTTFTELRMDLLNEDVQIDFLFLNRSRK